MSCCSELTPFAADVTAPSTVEPTCPCRRPGVTDRLVVEVDARSGLVNLERIVSLLRGRNHPVAGLSTDLRGERAVIAVWGEGLHDGDDEALVLRRLRRLPGVLQAWVEPPSAPA